MKIGIFGDSFADEFNLFRSDNMSWANQIRNLGHTVDNYAKCASSLYFSYRQLKEHHSQYDKVIFVITGEGRLYLDHLPEQLQHVSHGRLGNLKNETKGQHTDTIKAIEYYYTHLHNYDYARVVHKLLLKECQIIRPDALFIPCFTESADHGVNFNLNMLSDYDYSFLPTGTHTSVNDRRFCHMNDNNNLLVAQRINEWLHGGRFEISPADFKPTTLPVTEILKLETPNI